ncbi:electron transfer flavoprotein [Amycolatopsis acidiphila]|uniref:Electron transfer flavoprotein small subunit n=1 Tax=Amycolatopsis acidiphila TaxID=715473 RepID=A0A558AII1_9PSEU|nr:electron transfer flavoprotein [Amycolatopsis acidiphila]TVT24076.1 electron transfer flavoprotein [Amycolatopsis acidiphila]UIJ57776.1 electron transfer flavoprotein [Amycolatopsis acidiphila]GHG87635.1 electron transfer flavoprotein subunit alpha [Amycolatopsis acidiphila]
MSTPGRILVCLKQVPVPGRGVFDERTKRIRRDDDQAVTNPLDLHALAQGMALRAQTGWEVVAVTMGPPAAAETLLDALRRGADRAVHLVDRRFAGADTLATARALARLVERERPDLVLTGRATLDGGTAQVGPQIAELAALPQLTQATNLRIGDGVLAADVETDVGREVWTVAMPAVISIGRGTEPPWVTEADPSAVETLTAEDLGGGPRDFGTRGSPTFVAEIRHEARKRSTEYVSVGFDAAELLEVAFAPAAPEAEVVVPAPSRQIWAVAEPLPAGGLHPASLEALACARSVAGELRASVVAVLPCDRPQEFPRVLYAHGADRVLVLRGTEPAEYRTDLVTDALSTAIAAHSPFAVIAPFTARGRDYAPRVAARLGLGLTGDFTALEVRDADTDEPDLLWLKPALSADVVAPVIAHSTPSMGTLRPGSFAVRAVRDQREPDVEFAGRSGAGDDLCNAVERRVEIPDAPRLAAARLVIGLGPGLGTGARRVAERVATTPGIALVATSAAVAAGEAPPQLEIGPLARSIAPAVYLGLGRHDLGTLQAVKAARRVVVVDPGAWLDAFTGLVDAVVTANVEGVLLDLLLAASRPVAS